MLAAVPAGGLVLVDGLVAGRVARRSREQRDAPAHRRPRAHGLGILPGGGPAGDRRRAPRAPRRPQRHRDKPVDPIRARGRQLVAARTHRRRDSRSRRRCRRRRGHAAAAHCCASASSPRTKGRTSWSRRSPRSARRRGGGARSSDRPTPSRTSPSASTARAADLGVADRITMPGVLADDELDAAYRAADLLVAPSRAESYGMAIADALAAASRWSPAMSAESRSRSRPVAPRCWCRPSRGAERALERWMVDPALRRRLKGAAVRGRSGLPRWSDTVDRVAAALEGVR